MTLRATEVFTPGSFPKRTYVERSGENLETRLRDALETEGQIVSLVGPSKSGKTVLVERVVGKDSLIPITGAGIRSAEDIWTRVLDWMGTPTSATSAKTASGSLGPIGGQLQSTAQTARTGLTQVIREIGGSSFVLLVDDFQYMPRDVQVEVAKSLKEAARQGVKICTVTVLHRGDDLVRSNPELRGRVTAVDLTYWTRADLALIGSRGFGALHLECDEASIDQLAVEAAGSPQLMQLLCLTTCFVLGFRARQSKAHDIKLSAGDLSTILAQASASTDFRSLVSVLHSGPRTRGTERKLYTFTDGSVGDVYQCVLRAIASDPPQLSFTYADLNARTARVCSDEPPAGSSITGTCVHMSRLALERFPDERAIEWDEQKQILDLPDPYLLFYLRWSGRLQESDAE